jgi:glucokinase
MSTSCVIGVDLGGTKILAGLIDADGGVHETVERPTVTSSQDALLAELVEAVRSLPQEGVTAVGFGIPSRIDHERGIALGAVNIPLRNVPFRDEMQERLGVGRGTS